MIEQRTGDIERGLALVPTIREVMEDQADAAIRAVYEDIRQSLRVPFVNFIYRVLANEPEFFLPAWQRLGPLCRTRGFEAAADRLRAEALLEPVPDGEAVRTAAGADLERVRAYTATIIHVVPKLLLTATFFDHEAGADWPAAHGSQGPDLADTRPGMLDGVIAIPMVDPATAGGKLPALFEDIQAMHGHPGVATYYRALGHWPDLLDAIWQQVRPRIGSAPFETKRGTLIDDADTAMRMLYAAARTHGLIPSDPIPLAADQRERLRAILAVFRLRIIPDLLIVVPLVQAMLDGSHGRS